MQYVPNGADPTLEHARQRVAGYQQHQSLHGFSKWLVLERRSGRPIGDAGLLVLEQEGWIDLGLRLARDWWGQGLATEAASAWVRSAFKDLGIAALGAFSHPDNRASIRVLEKPGFKPLRPDVVMGMTAITFRLQRGDAG